MTVHDPIDFVCGDTWNLTGPLTDGNGIPLNLIGAAIAWKLDSLDYSVNFITCTLGNGITILDPGLATIIVEVTPLQTIGLDAVIYRDSLRVTLATGQIFTEWTGAIRASTNPT